jgi:hypothetical protein
MPELARDLRAYVDRLAELAEEAVADPTTPSTPATPTTPATLAGDGPAAGAVRRRPSRRVALAGAVAAALVAVVAIVAVTRGDGGDRVRTRLATADVEVEGPSGSRWFVLDLPGLTPRLDHRQEATTSPAMTLQAYRTSADPDSLDGLGGPMVWVASDPVIDDAMGLDPAQPGVTGTTVQGAPAYMRRWGETVSVSWPRTGAGMTLVTAVGLPAEDVLALAEGIRPRGQGEGVDTTVLPRGLVEVTPGGPRRYPSEDAYWSYRREGLTHSLVVETGQGLRFETGLWGAVNGGSGTVETLSVGGRPGLITQDPERGTVAAVWRPTDTEIAHLTTSGTREDLIAALEALQPVDEATWLDQFPDPTPAGLGDGFLPPG